MQRGSRTMVVRALVASCVLAGAGTAGAEPMTVLIWGGGRAPADAEKALQSWQAAGKAADLKLPPGFPRIIESTPVKGLKPGFHIVVLGFCSPEAGPAVVARLKEVDPQAYIRNVEWNEIACPELLARAAPAGAAAPPGAPKPPADAAPPAAPGQKLFALIKSRGQNRAQLEATVARLLQEQGPRVRYAPGHPFVEARKRLPFKQDQSEAFYVVAGVCPADRAQAVADAFSSEAVELLRGTAACPTVLEGGVERAFQSAVYNRLMPFAEELLAIPVSKEIRTRYMEEAAEHCDVELAQRILAAGAIDAGEALPKALVCAGPGYPADEAADAKRSEALVTSLLAAGADPKPHGDWIARALGAGRLPVAKKLVAAGADPRTAAGAILGTAAEGSPEALKWALSLGLDPKQASGTSPLLAAAARQKPENVALLLRAQADAAARGKESGLTALDLYLLVPSFAADKTAVALVEGRRAFAAAYRGDLQALSALPAAELNERWGGWTPVAVAAARGKDEVGIFLVEHGVDLDVRVGNRSGLGGHDLLSLAIDGGARKLALALVQKGVPLDTPAGACCLDREQDGDVVQLREPSEVLSMRLEDFAGSPPERWSRKETRYGKAPPLLVQLQPIHRAAMAGQVDVVRALIAKGVDPNARDGSGQGLTAAMLAAERGLAPVLKALAEAKADPGLKDAGRYSALAHATLAKDPEAAVKAVVAAFGKKAAEGAAGALSAAVVRGEKATVERLLSLGAGRRGEGKRAALTACQYGKEDLFELLEAKGFSTGKKFWGDCVEEGD